MSFISLNNVSFKYPNNNKWVLKDVNLKIQGGEFICILGRSGSGKSTLTKILNGLIPNVISGDVNGKLSINGFNERNLNEPSLMSISGTVFQNPEFQLINNFVYEEFNIDSDIDYYLNLFGISNLKFRRISELSSGEKQMVAIASVFSYNPSLVILDEPTSNLDEILQQRFFEHLENIKGKNNTSVVIIEHQIEKIKRLIDRFYFIEDRNLKELDEINPEEKTLPPMCRCSVPFENDVPLLEVNNISYSDNNGFKLNDISFHLNRGEILGLTGPNGSGKSTIASIIMRIKKNTSGEILFKGKKYKKNNGEFGMVVQNPLHQIFCSTVYEEISFAPENFRNFSEKYVDKIIDVLGLSYLKHRSPLTLSFGEQERTAIASAFSYQPEIVIIDEPTLGQDDVTIKNLMGFILKERKRGKSFITISHNKNLLNRICNRIITLKNGTLTTTTSEK